MLVHESDRVSTVHGKQMFEQSVLSKERWKPSPAAAATEKMPLQTR